VRKGAALLLVLGLLQMAADAVGLGWLKGLAAATGASPAPRVFSAVRGFETFSTRFSLEWTDASGTTHTLPLTSEVYRNLEGPYNRRNVYGAALAYGPVLAEDERTRPMLDAILRHALREPGTVLRELGGNPDEVVGPIRILYEPLAGTQLGDLPRQLEVPAP